MRAVLIWAARSAGVLGVVTMVLAVAGRLSGAYWLGGFQMGTLLQAGMAAMLAACLAYLVALAEQPGGASPGR
jgi:hypothetical protein